MEGAQNSKLAFLVSIADKQPRKLSKGETLFRMADPATSMYILLKGQLKMVRFSSEGHAIIIHQVRPGGTFAEASVYSEGYHCDAVANSATEVLSVSNKRIREALGSDAKFAIQFSSYLAHQVQAARSKFEISNLRKAEDRIIAYFGLLADKAEVVKLDVPIKAAASEIGLSHESFYRCLPILEANGSISRTDKKTFILHRAA
jgi:CRP/FNR family transcriptional regulator, dissimilatory nitrate respiration regulator